MSRERKDGLEALPGTASPRIVSALGEMDAERRHAVIQHVLGGTNAEYLVDWFHRAGFPDITAADLDGLRPEAP